MSDRIPYEYCPLCESTSFSQIRVADCSGHPLYNSQLTPTIVWQQCMACSHIFTEGYYTDEACRIVFGKVNENQMVGGAVEDNRIVSSRMIEKVLPYASDGIWLDIGFGNGSLLFTVQEYGFKPVGTDLRQENVDIMKSLGIDAYNEDLTRLTLGEKCSVISMADVLEHMPFPGFGLIAANRLLQNQGVLLISMPNTENILWRLMNEQNANPYWGELEHYHNFSRTRLYALLEEHGFMPARYGISERYRASMEIVAVKERHL